MSGYYTKLFSSITESTIWSEPDYVRVLWITMLSKADQHGRVWASIPGLAHLARISNELCEEALNKLLSPDPYSRTPDHEGRRIEKIDGGWRLLNHGKYREIKDSEDLKEKARLRKQKQRMSQKMSRIVTDVTQCHDNITEQNKTEEKKENKEEGCVTPFEDSWKLWKKYRSLTMIQEPVAKQLLTGRGWSEEKMIRAINASIAKGWKDIYDPDGKPENAQGNGNNGSANQQSATDKRNESLRKEREKQTDDFKQGLLSSGRPGDRELYIRKYGALPK